jgi:hypothetical protein
MSLLEGEFVGIVQPDGQPAGVVAEGVRVDGAQFAEEGALAERCLECELGLETEFSPAVGVGAKEGLRFTEP